MSTVELLHNDDEVLNPLDSTLRARGSLLVDGEARGSWEEHLDGHFIGRIGAHTLNAPNQAALIALISQRLDG
jgi:hypothetical protein